MGRKRYRLSEVVAEVREEHPPIEIETDDGQVFEVPPPELWPDEVVELATTRPVDSARLVMGERYDQFIAAGGSAGLLSVIVQRESLTRMGESPGS